LELAAEHETGKNSYVIMPTKTRLIFGPDTPSTNPYNLSVTPDVLDIVI